MGVDGKKDTGLAVSISSAASLSSGAQEYETRANGIRKATCHSDTPAVLP